MLILFALTYILSLFSLFIYSYSQIDLNLTLSSNHTYQTIQNSLINLGYFRRDLSSLIFLLVIFFMVFSYFGLLYAISKKAPKGRFIVLLITATAFLGLISYPAFSHDIFNYIFDARIFTKYGQNPYLFKALDFPDDQWVRFMHWTHRTYPYGPLWLIITIPFSFISSGKFLLTLLSFKAIFLFSYLVNILMYKKISEGEGRPDPVFSLSVFAFNPLIIIETLISPHNESLMLFFLLYGVYMMLKEKFIASLLLLLFSAGIKFITAPLMIPFLMYKKFGNIGFERFIYICLALLAVPIIFLVFSREFYPWYFVTFAGLALLLDEGSTVKSLVLSLSAVLPLRYFEFLQKGDYKLINPLSQELYYLLPGFILFFLIRRIKLNVLRP